MTDKVPWLTIGLTLCVVCSVGCSRQPRTYPVAGRVQFPAGSPVMVGVVEFQSLEHGLNARGDIQRDGTFQLTTFEPNDGAVAGEHKCVVLQMVVGENISGHRPSKLGVVHPRYASYSTSGLTAQVNDNGDNSIVLEVEGVLETQPPADQPHKH
ncbi:MAG: carboxypeptidase regulatory-like domain-containing protein [bacterium]|nr:carboxypeptidase regulatory-like domain-containing protein [bacterium]